jgi:hypothetical protein
MSRQRIEQPGRSHIRRILRWAIPALAMGASLVALGTYSGREPSGAPTPTAKSIAVGAANDANTVPQFAQPEQAERYFDAVIDGNHRALEVLDEALAAARRQPDTDPQQIAALTAEREKRAERLRALEVGRP